MDRHGRTRSALSSAIVLGSLLCLPGVAGATSPAAPPRPDPIVKPDGLVAKGLTGAPIGNDIYNTTGVDQAVIGGAKPGNQVTFVITIGNDGNVVGSMRVQAAGSSAGYRLKYLSGTTDVTSDVVAGTFATGAVKPGEAVVLVAKVTVKPTAAVGSKTSRLVTITGPGAAQLTDVVKFTAKRR